MTPGDCVAHVRLGLGVVVPSGPGTPPGYVRVDFEEYGTFAIREDNLEELEGD